MCPLAIPSFLSSVKMGIMMEGGLHDRDIARFEQGESEGGRIHLWYRWI